MLCKSAIRSSFCAVIIGLAACGSNALAGNAAGNLDQGANGKYAAPTSPITWQNGDLNDNNSHFLEGYSVPYRLKLTNLDLSLASHTVTIEWDVKHSGGHALDYITQYERFDPHTPFGHAAETVDPTTGIAGLGAPSTFAIPAPSDAGSQVAGQPTTSFNALVAGKRVMTIWNGTITGMAYVSEGAIDGATNTSSTSITITFTTSNSTVLLAWGGHIATADDWGAGNSAGGITGSPYHMRFLDLDGGGGNQDRSLKSAAVAPTCGVSGADSVCASTQSVYTANTNASSNPTFSWVLTANSSGATIVGSDTDPTVTVDSGASAGSYTVQLSITQNGITVTCFSAAVTVSGPPDISCPPDATVECNDPTTPDVTGTATSSDQTATIDHSDSPSKTCGNTSVITRKWTATNGASCGTSSCDQIISIVDTTPPSITCPPDTTVECPGSADPRFTGTATASDTCGQISNIFSSDDNFQPVCGTTGIISRTWTATDACNNSSSCTQTIAYTDTTPPTITCPADVTVECSGDVPQADFEGGNDSDTCGSVKLSHNDVSDGKSCPETITRTYTATDDCKNAASCAQTIVIYDQTPPHIACPANQTVECGTDTTPATTGSASATDTCGPTLNAPTDQIVPGNCASNYTILRHWSALDACNNTSSCTQTITVEDTTAPTITCPGNIVRNTDRGVCSAVVTFNTTATDRCDANPVVSCSPSSGETFPLGKTTVTCSATDCTGNTSAGCSFTVTVQDLVPPTIHCPGNIIRAADPGVTTAVVTYTATATDNGVAVTPVCAPPSGSSFPQGTTTVTCTVSGCASLTATCSFTVTVTVATGVSCGFTQGGWGSKPSGNNPGTILKNNFSAVYPGGFVEVGIPGAGGFSMIFKSAAAIKNYLPASSTPAALTKDYPLNPTKTTSGVFGGQVLALQLNVDFNTAGVLSGTGTSFGHLMICNTGNPLLDGQTVAQVLAAANQALGGGARSYGYTISQLNDLVDNLNSSMDDCTASLWAMQHLCQP